MFGVGFWELVIIAVVGLIVCVGPLAAIVTVIAMSASNRDRGPDERGA
jgi:hypothetical protein